MVNNGRPIIVSIASTGQSEPQPPSDPRTGLSADKEPVYAYGQLAPIMSGCLAVGRLSVAEFMERGEDLLDGTGQLAVAAARAGNAPDFRGWHDYVQGLVGISARIDPATGDPLLPFDARRTLLRANAAGAFWIGDRACGDALRVVFHEETDLTPDYLMSFCGYEGLPPQAVGEWLATASPDERADAWDDYVTYLSKRFPDKAARIAQEPTTRAILTDLVEGRLDDITVSGCAKLFARICTAPEERKAVAAQILSMIAGVSKEVPYLSDAVTDFAETVADDPGIPLDIKIGFIGALAETSLPEHNSIRIRAQIMVAQLTGLGAADLLNRIPDMVDDAPKLTSEAISRMESDWREAMVDLFESGVDVVDGDDGNDDGHWVHAGHGADGIPSMPDDKYTLNVQEFMAYAAKRLAQQGDLTGAHAAISELSEPSWLFSAIKQCVDVQPDAALKTVLVGLQLDDLPTSGQSTAQGSYVGALLARADQDFNRLGEILRSWVMGDDIPGLSREDALLHAYDILEDTVRRHPDEGGRLAADFAGVVNADSDLKRISVILQWDNIIELPGHIDLRRETARMSDLEEYIKERVAAFDPTSVSSEARTAAVAIIKLCAELATFRGSYSSG